jgi:hypothetical protein
MASSSLDSMFIFNITGYKCETYDDTVSIFMNCKVCSCEMIPGVVIGLILKGL